MFSQPIASRMAVESTRRALSEPERVVRSTHPRRAHALVLKSAAHRLDAYVTAAPQTTIGGTK